MGTLSVGENMAVGATAGSPTGQNAKGLLPQIAADEILSQAYSWLCSTRIEAHYNSDVWHLRFHWTHIKPMVQQQLLQGEYHFSPCKSLTVGRQSIGQWSAQDALVLKAMTIVLSPVLAAVIPANCVHIAGRGGAKGCVAGLQEVVEDYRFVCRSDVNSYYATMNHAILQQELASHIDDEEVLSLIANMLARLDDVHAELYLATKGITEGNPLSPLLGGLYLRRLDVVLGNYCEARGLVYQRFMDDWIVLCKTRNQLRTVVRLMNGVLDDVKMTKHPFKTFIGRIKEDGFDFLGYRIARKAVNGLAVAWRTWCNRREKLNQLYEQGVSQEYIGGYVKRWLCWVRSGVEIDLERALSGFNIGANKDEIGLYRQFY